MKQLVYEIEDSFQEGEEYSEIDRLLRVIRRDVTRYIKSIAAHRNVKRRPPPPDPHVYESFSKTAGPTVNRLAKEYLTAILEKPKRRSALPKNLPPVLPIFAGGPYAEVKEEQPSVCRIHDHWDLPSCSSYSEEDFVNDELPVLFVNEGEEAPVETPATKRFYMRNSLRYGSPDGSHATTICVIHPDDDYYLHTEEDIALGAAQFVQPSVSQNVLVPVVAEGLPVVEECPPPVKEFKQEPLEDDEEMPLLKPVDSYPIMKNGEMRISETLPPKRKRRSPTPVAALRVPALRLPRHIPEEDFMLSAEIFIGAGRTVPEEVTAYWKRKEEEKEMTKTTKRNARKRKLSSPTPKSISPPPVLDRISKSSSTEPPQLYHIDSSYDAMDTDSDSKSDTRPPSLVKEEDDFSDEYASELREIYKAVPPEKVQAFHEELKTRLLAAVLEENNNKTTPAIEVKIEVFATSTTKDEVKEEASREEEEEDKPATVSLGSSSDSDATTSSPFTRESSSEKTPPSDDALLEEEESSSPKVPPLILRRFSMDDDLYPRYTLREGFSPSEKRKTIASQL